jgi:pimeloyl-ACP methyl ester carboxylesterase
VVAGNRAKLYDCVPELKATLEIMPVLRSITFKTVLLILLAGTSGQLVASFPADEQNEQLGPVAFASVIRSPKTLGEFAKPRSKFLRTAQIRIHYLEWNSKALSTVVLLHGLNDTAEIWTKVAPLVAAGHRVIAPDRRGSGRTDKPVSGYDLATLTRDVIALIDGLKLSRVHLVGHSAGGGVVLMAAATNPAKVETVALIDGGFWPKRPDSETTAPYPECSAKDLDCQRSAAILKGNMEYDPEPLYGRVMIPALLVVSHPPDSESAQLSSQIAEAHEAIKLVAEQKLKQGQFAVIRETGHWIQTDQPAALAEILIKFLKSKPPVTDNEIALSTSGS